MVFADRFGRNARPVLDLLCGTHRSQHNEVGIIDRHNRMVCDNAVLARTRLGKEVA